MIILVLDGAPRCQRQRDVNPLGEEGGGEVASVSTRRNTNLLLSLSSDRSSLNPWGGGAPVGRLTTLGDKTVEVLA